MGILSHSHVEAKSHRLLLLTALAVLLYVGSGVAMAYIAGFDRIWDAARNPSWPWLAASLGGVALAFVGYYFGYRGIGRIEEGPEDLSHADRLAVVAAGFGGFLAHGGGGIDRAVMRAAGASEREAKVRVTLLGGLEHLVLAIPCSVAAILLILQGVWKPPLDFLVPWAVGPAAGFGIAYWAAERYRERLRGRGGWREKLSILLDAAHLIGVMFRNPLRYASAISGMLLYWLADMFALWAGIAAFGYRMNGASLMVAFGTAMIVTRRTGPLGGAGLLGMAIAATVWYSGASWPAAVLGTFSYRFFALWPPQPVSFLMLPRLRRLLASSPDADAPTGAEEGAGERTEEPALR
ncbi:MAG TPA: hypothetical protein VE984_07760 [Gaiellaceae bacterium]|nr:hypothetical protein [Gaiellaceae bacterium]